MPVFLPGESQGQRSLVGTCPELSAQGLVPLRWGCALPSPNAPGKAPNHIHTIVFGVCVFPSFYSRLFKGMKKETLNIYFS